MISILCPTRGRPKIFERMIRSIHNTKASQRNIELLIYLDHDDSCLASYDAIKDFGGRPKYLMCSPSLDDGKARTVGEAWNILASRARGDYLLMGNDDHVYVTPHWDRMLLDILSERMPKDGIFVAWVDDKTGKAANRCAFPIVSRKWYETLGYFTPECFHFLYHDTWVWDIGKRLNRTIYIPEIVVEHRHFTVGKAEYDDTYRRHRMGIESGRKREADKQMFNSTAGQRQADADKLKDLIISKVYNGSPA